MKRTEKRAGAGWRRALVLMMTVIMAAVLMTSCGQKAPAGSTESEFEPVVLLKGLESPLLKAAKSVDLVKNASVLTGEEMDEELIGKRPLALMIENSSWCQPQYGVSKAGVIYECPVEGNITRMMGIFEDFRDLDRLGNVRSCRPYYPRLAAEYDAIYLCYGASTQGKSVLASGLIDNINGLTDGTGVYYRSSDRKAPQNAYTSTDRVLNGFKTYKYRTEYKKKMNAHFNFAARGKEIKLENGEDAAVCCPYFYDNHPYFIYDAGTGMYKRYQFGGPQIDAVDGKQLEVKNVIWVYCKSSMYDIKRVNIDVLGSGVGKYFTNGKVIDIKWTNDSYKEPTQYFTADGEPLEINRGKTWICVMQQANTKDNKIYATEAQFH